MAIVVVAAGAGLPGLNTSVSAASFLDHDDPALEATEDRSRLFGDDPLVVLFDMPADRAVVAPTLTSLVVLERDLAALPGVARVDGPGSVIDAALGGVARVLGGILATVDGRRLQAAEDARREAEAAGLPDDQVDAAVTAAIQEADEPQMRRYGPLLAQHMRLGLPELDNAAFTRAIALDGARPRPLVELVVPDAGHVAIHVRPTSASDAGAVSDLVRQVRDTVDASPLRDEPHVVTGAPVVTAAVAEDVRQELPRLALVGLLAMAVLLWFANPAPRPLAPLAGVGAGLVVALGTLGWLGLDLGLGAVAITPIVLGLGTDFGVNVGQWYVDARGRGLGAVDAVGDAWVRTLPPLGLSSLVAAAAAVVAIVAPSPTIRALGIALPWALLASLTTSLVINGAVLATAPASRRATPWDRLRDRVAARGRRGAPGGRRRARAMVMGVLLVGAAGWVALPMLAVESDLPALIGDSDELRDARRAERVLGAAGTVEVLVEAPDVTDPVVLDWINGVVGEVAHAEGERIRPLLWPDRLLSWLGPDADAAAIRRGLGALPEALTSAVLLPDQGAAAATFGIPWSSSSEQARMLELVRGAASDPPDGVRARLAGLPVLVASAYEDVAATPVTDTLMGLGAAAAVLLVVLRRRGWAPVAVLVVAAGLRIAVLAIVEGALNPITLSLIAFVAAVDAEFTLVLLAARRRGPRARRVAVRVTGVSAATAAIGFGVLVLSDMAGVRSFGLMAAVSVLAGWLGAVAMFGGPDAPADRTASRPPATRGRRLAAGAAAGALLLSGCTDDGALAEGVLVEVGEATITEDDVQDRIAQLRALYQIDVPAPGTDEHRAFRSDLLASMVAVELVEEGARRRGVRVPEADVTDQLDSYRAASYPWEEDYRAALAATGIGERQVRRELRYQLLQARLFEDVTADVQVDDATVAAAYDEEPGRFDLPERRRVRHVVVADEDAAEEARRLLASGSPFEQVAAELSLDEATRANGGELGWVTQDQLLDGFGPAVFSLEVGEVSSPIRTELGVHVAQVTDVEPAGPTERSEALAALRQQLLEERREARWRSWLDELWKSVDTRYADGVEPVDRPLDVVPSVDDEASGSPEPEGSGTEGGK